MPTNTCCSDTLYVHTDPDNLPGFAEESSFGNSSSDSKAPFLLEPKYSGSEVHVL